MSWSNAAPSIQILLNGLWTFSILILRSAEGRVSKDEDGHEWAAHISIFCVCADDSYYVGSTRKDLDARVAEHNDGIFKGYTSSRRPVSLAFAERFDRIADAIAAERRIKGWSRAKKEALIAGDWAGVIGLSQRRKPFDRATASFETPAARAPQDEVE